MSILVRFIDVNGEGKLSLLCVERGNKWNAVMLKRAERSDGLRKKLERNAKRIKKIC